MDKLTLSLAQMDVAQGDPEANLIRADELAREAAARGSDMLILPELWTTGFDWGYNAARLDDQQAVAARVAGMARDHGVWLGGSMLARAASGQAVNAFMLFDSSGRLAARYHKIHLFSLIGEDRHMQAGDSPVMADTPWGPMGLAVCYDLRFPELFRAYALAGARLMLMPAAFPLVRRGHWDLLIRARALENQCFVAGINQVGRESLPGSDTAIEYGGGTQLADPLGEIAAMALDGSGELLTVEADLSRADQARKSMGVLSDVRPGACSRQPEAIAGDAHPDAADRDKGL